MASILTRKSRIAQPQDFVLVDDALGDFHAAYVINNTLFNAKTGALPAKNSNFTGGIGLGGSYLEPNANDKTLNPGIPAGDVYGVLYLFEVRQADITSASNAASIISVTENVNDASGVRIGSSTGYLTGETLAVVNAASTRRTGISETIPKGLHTLVVQWNGSKYEIWLDGHLPAQLVAAGGDTQLLNFAPYIGLRSLSSQPRLGTYLFATSNNKNIDFREYQENPWRLLKPLQARIWVPVGGSGPTYTLTASNGSLALTGTASGLYSSRLLTAAQAALSLAGTATGLLAGRVVAAAPGAFALSGNAASLLAGRSLAATVGGFTYTGNAASLTYTPLGAYSLTADTGSFATTGNAAALSAARLLGASVGAFTLTGNAATLTYSPLGAYTLTADSGSFVLTGAAAGFSASRQIAAASGSFALTGNAASLLRGYALTGGTGAYILTGNDAALTYTAQASLLAETGAFTLTGGAVTFTYSGTPPEQAETIFTIPSERRIFTVASEQRIFKD